MLVIPAIDLKDGACVRLRQDNIEDTMVFSDDPVAVAGKWVEAGCKRLHLVDLNGAFEGKPVNAPIIQAIAHKYPDLPIQVGGGVRTLETIDQYLMTGVNYVIIGTKAVKDPGFIKEACQNFPETIIVGIDAKEGLVATDGWSEISSHKVEDIAKRFEDYGVSAIIYTDIARDGMMQGCNIEHTAALAASTSIPIIASGGVHTIDDIKVLLDAKQPNITGVITGRAIYENTLNLAEAQILCDSYKINK